MAVLYLLIQDTSVLNTKSLLSKTRSKSSTKSNIDFSGEKPTAYKLIINFIDEKYQHTHTFNGIDEVEIKVIVKGKPSILNVENSLRIAVDYYCTFSNQNSNFHDDFRVNGSLNYKKSIYVIGNRSQEEIIESLHEEVIKEIMEKLE